ncbi:hypothetical protein [Micromonospora sp. HM5-17]|uniref:hypothetical protein n=1 Tax=Micromonospora sp. HM5-17 TaxID=2487710 RepID=UPI001315A8F2|nr:hypothetical protein [Micromonospora sp. HM5-17]
MDHRQRYDGAVAPRLEPGERILALSEVTRPRGVAPAPPPPPPRPESGDGARVAAMTVAGAALGGVEFLDSIGGGGPTDWLVRLLFGRAARGRLDSVAADFLRAVPTGVPLLAVVTDRRLMVLRIGRPKAAWPFGGADRPLAAAKLKPLWSVPRTEVAGARRRWHRLHGGRLRVSFRDGSWLEFTGPFRLGWRRAGELRDALTA